LENLWIPDSKVDGPIYQQATKAMVGDCYFYVTQNSDRQM
jgi:hypothetical protein